ncbi:MAG: glycosyltransferase family 39 protein, partial [Chloroflexota bacterium]
ILFMTALTGTLTLHTLYPGSTSVKRKHLIALAGIFVAIYLVRAWGLSVYPEIELTDEPWLLSFAVGYDHNGFIFDAFMQNFLPESTVTSPRVFALHARWMQLTDFTLWHGRLFYLLMSLPVIAFTAWAAHNKEGTNTALMTAITMVASMLLVQSGRLRHDVLYALCLAGSLWLFTLAQKRDSLWLHTAAGAAAGAGIYAHLNAAPFGVILLVSLYTPLLLSRDHQGIWQKVIAFAAGGAIAAAVYGILIVLPNWTDFTTVTAPRATTGGENLLFSLRGHIRNVFWQSRLEFLLIVGGMVHALYRRRPFDLSLVMFVVLAHITLGIISTDPNTQYVRQIVPVYGLLVARLLTVGLSNTASVQAVFARAMIPIVLLGTTLMTPLRHIATGGDLLLPPTEAATWIQNNAPEDASIVGSHLYYLWLHDYDYTSTYLPRVLLRNYDSAAPPDADIWAEIAPDYIIIDYESPGWMRPPGILNYIEANNYSLWASFEGADIYERPQ